MKGTGTLFHDPAAVLFEDQDIRLIDSLAAALVNEHQALSEVTRVAADLQWSPAPIPRPRDDTTERGQGGKSDPTQAAALDGRRIELRAATAEAARSLESAVTALQRAHRRLGRALDAWSGEKVSQ